VQAGRVSDFVLSPHDGSLVSGASLCHYILACGPDVGQIQIIQDARDHLTIRIKRESSGELASAMTTHIRGVVDRMFHGQMHITFEPCQRIPHEASGKYRFCINRYVSTQQMDAERVTSQADDTPSEKSLPRLS
jgi:hypothetical protein